MEILACEEIVDKHGRQILLPVLRPTTAEAVEAKKKAASDTNATLLKALAADPTASERDLATCLGISQQAVNKKLQKLKDKFIEKGADERWRLSKRGRAEVVKPAPEKG